MLAFARSARNDAADAPHGEEAFLHRVLGEPLVAEDPMGDAVCDPADAVVELAERAVVSARDERDQRLVG